MSSRHKEHHKIHRSGRLRAGVLGANDGILSTASLILGVVAAGAEKDSIIMAGTAGLVAGAISMAAGEYVSVKSQEDTELADLEVERKALEEHPDEEEHELAEIYTQRGLDEPLAMEVAKQLMAHDALAAHARDEIGITDELSAHPIQAALWSAISFSIGAAAPVICVYLSSMAYMAWTVPILTITLLGTLGAVAARAGGAPRLRGAVRVCFWGMLAMGLTAAVGALFQVAV